MKKLKGLVWIPIFLIPLLAISCGRNDNNRIHPSPERDFTKQGTNTNRLRGSVPAICAEDIEVYGAYI